MGEMQMLLIFAALYTGVVLFITVYNGPLINGRVTTRRGERISTAIAAIVFTLCFLNMIGKLG